eukprot:4045218-Prymnesium_polylepis.1
MDHAPWHNCELASSAGSGHNTCNCKTPNLAVGFLSVFSTGTAPLHGGRITAVLSYVHIMLLVSQRTGEGGRP